MTKCPRLSCNRPRHRRSRWVGAAVVIIGVHISGVAIGMMKWVEPGEPPAAMPPAVMINMQPLQPPPPPQKQPEPEPEIDIPDAEIPPEPELSEFLPPPPPEVEPVVQMAPKVEKKKEETKKAAEKPKEKVKKKDETKKVVEKPKEKEKKKVTEQAKIVPPPSHDKVFKTASDAPSETMQEVEKPAQQSASAAGGSSSTAGQSKSGDGQTGVQLAAATAAKSNWNALLAAHINEYKKYPAAAKRRNKTGSPQVQFSIDRGGNVQNVQLTHWIRKRWTFSGGRHPCRPCRRKCRALSSSPPSRSTLR